MEQKSSRKRSFYEDEDSIKQPMQKRVRFPKGKKVKPGNETVDIVKDNADDGPADLKNPHFAATERAKRRSQMTFELCSEESEGIVNDITAAEVTYEGDENFVDDGIQIEPFNLEKEREEGYFDAEGNFVEYINENEIKDAWLDSLELDQRFVGTAVNHNKDVDSEDDGRDLSSEELGVIKRRIANVLEPGETVMQALRRLKGTTNKKEKMSAETKCVFDQLTEDAMKLMEENGEYNVYNENRETFEREAGYERLAQLRGKGTAVSFGQGNSNSTAENYLFSDATDPGSASVLLSNSATENLTANATGTETAPDADDAYDMFADDDENASAKPSSDGLNTVSGTTSNAVGQPSSDALNTASDSGSLQNDYIYDESSGYYYSSSLGYYYDPSTGLYCSAASGLWYSFNEETGAYEEVKEIASSGN
ncbi:CD2 antigen cytoplasmic tail-binding protein 2-like [Melia azedarach]|uniref:CD2 antigen cytoplasmic tail-binding protein 2-like n=1 Tax=Melia azedarach TaxID=155640 RepID=A0ACC1XXM2_MELAZ|nr:CD2 antigen cytoplasmic tail-binding protein 2-like [Melia azedarach]